MLLKLEKKVASFIEANSLFYLADSKRSTSSGQVCSSRADKILLAVSGGADSTALLYAMCMMKDKKILRGDILCAHINHQLRGSESEGDEAFVIEHAHKLNLAATTKRLDVRGFAHKNKLSIETAARKLRIESLLDVAQANNCKWVVTAHQKDDNAETIIHRLIRGTGFRGLGGIWPVRKFSDDIGFVRPLLCVSRDEVLEYLNKRGLKWRVDRTNDDYSYRRNFIRQRLLPELQKHCEGPVIEQLWKLSQLAQRFYCLVCSETEKVWPIVAEVSNEMVTLNLKSFSTQPQSVKVEIIRRGLVCLGAGERDLTNQHYERVLQLSRQNVSGRKIELPDGFIARREYNRLIFARIQKTAQLDEQVSESIEVQVPGRTRFGGYLIEADIFEAGEKNFEEFRMQKTNFVEWFDLDKVSLPLVVRSREQGDKFVPLGLRGEKKVGKFLTAAKTPREIRKKTLIVVDIEKVIWVWPVRMCEQAKVTGETRKILQLRVADAKIVD